MNLKDIAVYVDHDAETPLRIKYAQRIAKQQQAMLTGIYLRRPHHSAKYFGTYIPADVVAELETRADAMEYRVRESFQSVTKGNTEAEWRSFPALPQGTLEVQLRCTDLLVLPTLSPRDEHLNSAYHSDSLLLSAGCPVVFVNALATADTGKAVGVVAWDGSREAARALRDAIPLLHDCRKTHVITIGDLWAGQVRPADPTGYLERHGIKASWEHIEQGKDPGVQILEFAESVGATLIVSGGYGHNRVGELVFGGVTRRLLTDATIPLLMSH